MGTIIGRGATAGQEIFARDPRWAAEFLPSPPFRGEREGPAPEAWEGEVGAGRRSGIPHLTLALSAPEGGEGEFTARAPLTPNRPNTPSRGAALSLRSSRRQGTSCSPRNVT